MTWSTALLQVSRSPLPRSPLRSALKSKTASSPRSATPKPAGFPASPFVTFVEPPKSSEPSTARTRTKAAIKSNGMGDTAGFYGNSASRSDSESLDRFFFLQRPSSARWLLIDGSGRSAL